MNRPGHPDNLAFYPMGSAAEAGGEPYLVGIKLLIRKYCLLVSHLGQILLLIV